MPFHKIIPAFTLTELSNVFRNKKSNLIQIHSIYAYELLTHQTIERVSAAKHSEIFDKKRTKYCISYKALSLL